MAVLLWLPFEGKGSFDPTYETSPRSGGTPKSSGRMWNISFVDRQWTKVKQRNKGTRHQPSFPLLVLLMISLFLQLSEQNTLFVLLASKHCSQIPHAMGQMKTQICQIGAKWASAPPYTKHSPAVGAIDKRYQPPGGLKIYIIILIHISPQIYEHKFYLKKLGPSLTSPS